MASCSAVRRRDDLGTNINTINCCISYFKIRVLSTLKMVFPPRIQRHLVDRRRDDCLTLASWAKTFSGLTVLLTQDTS